MSESHLNTMNFEAASNLLWLWWSPSLGFIQTSQLPLPPELFRASTMLMYSKCSVEVFTNITPGVSEDTVVVCS